MRVTALAEPDDAPLFGYIRFRRRNMLVKYVPAATSRVVKGAWAIGRIGAVRERCADESERMDGA